MFEREFNWVIVFWFRLINGEIGLTWRIYITDYVNLEEKIICRYTNFRVKLQSDSDLSAIKGISISKGLGCVLSLYIDG